MSRARKKGTEGENFFLEHLRELWPSVERAPLKGIKDAGDYVNVPFPIEAKNCNTPRFPEWLRKLRPKCADHRWLIVWKGDMRTTEGRPVMVMDFAFGLELLRQANRPVVCAVHDDVLDLAADEPDCVHVQIVA